MRVAVADDCPFFRRGLVGHLTDLGVEVVAQAGDGSEILTLAEHLAPDAVVLDIAMPPGRDGGITAAESLRNSHPSMGILALSVYAETDYATRLLTPDPSGRGYLIKDRTANAEMLRDALNRVCTGGTVVDAEIIGRLTNIRRDHPERSTLGSLTPRELEVLQLIAEGYNNKAIADRLTTTESTVGTHICNIGGKLGIDASRMHHRRVRFVIEYLRAKTAPDA